MRKAFLFSGLAAIAAILIGCGGSGGGGSVGNTSSKIAVGYVYVATDKAPAGSPGTVITSSATAPDGYAAPTAGTLTLHVDDGTITRTSADENFDMTDANGNAIVARVVSHSSGTPELSYSGSGFQSSGQVRPNIPTQTLSMSGSNDTIFALDYLSPTYTPGAVAAVKVLVRDPNGADKFGAPGDIIPVIIPTTNHALDDYDILAIPLDANNVVVTGAPAATITDPNSNSTENAVAEGGGVIAVSGGGVENTDVTITATISGVSTVFTTKYSYGAAATYNATFSPVGPTSLIWPAAGPAGSQSYIVSVKNIHGVPVPNLTVTFTRGDTNSTATSAGAPDPYPGPATGNAINLADPATDIAGFASVTFQTPAGAAGNSNFNVIAIKGTNHLQIRAGNSTGVVIGASNVVISRPLASLAITGPSRLDVNTTSKVANGINIAYQVTGAVDIDTLAVAAPGGVYTWALTPLGNGGVTTIGDPDNTTLRGVAAPSFATANGNASITVNAGANAGQFDITATNGVVSNAVTTGVFGPPSKVILSPTPTVSGYHGAAGSPQSITASYQDAFGHNVTSESTTLTKSGSVNSAGASITFPGLPSLVYNAVLPNSNGTATATLGLTGNWTGTGQGTTVGSSSWNLSRAVDLVVP